MSTFTQSSMTERGLGLMSNIVAGQELLFTRIAVGDGNLLSGQTAANKTSLTSPLFDVAIQSVRADGQGQCTVQGAFTNADNDTGFYYREIGLYAEDPNSGEEVLYCYGNAGAGAEWITAAGGGTLIEKIVKLVVLCGATTNVTANFNHGIYPSVDELNFALATKADLDAPNTQGGRVLAEQMRFDEEQTLYVDASAGSTGDGSEGNPFRTIQQAVNARYKGAAVIYIKIKAGTYNESVSVPRSPDTTWRFSCWGDGTVLVNGTMLVDNCMYCVVDDMTFSNATAGVTLLHIANTACAVVRRVVVNGATNVNGIYFSNSRGTISYSEFNNCEVAVYATGGAFIATDNLSGSGNNKAFHASGSVIMSDGNRHGATIPHEVANGGAVNVLGGEFSFPSNFSHLKYLGNAPNVETMQELISAEFWALAPGQVLHCQVANNINGGFGIYNSGQMLELQIIRASNDDGGEGLVLFKSHDNAPMAFIQIVNGEFQTVLPVAFITAAGGLLEDTLFSSTGISAPAFAHRDGAAIWLFGKDEPTYKGGMVLRIMKTDGSYNDVNIRSDGMFTWQGKNLIRSINGALADINGNIELTAGLEVVRYTE